MRLAVDAKLSYLSYFNHSFVVEAIKSRRWFHLNLTLVVPTKRPKAKGL